MKILSTTILPLLFLILACQAPHQFKKLPEGPINHQLICVAKTPHGIKARGFEGATPAGTAISFVIDQKKLDLNSKADGSFAFEMPMADLSDTKGRFTFKTNAQTYEQDYEIKNLSDSLRAIAKRAFLVTGQTDDVSVDKDFAYLLSLPAAQVSKIKVDPTWVLSEKEIKNVLLNPDPREALLPRSLATKGDYSVVTLSGSHEVALINNNDDSLISKSKLKDEKGELYLFDINPPLVVNNPISAGQGSSSSTSIARSFAHTPEQVLALDDQSFVVSFSNYYQHSDPSENIKAVLGPALIALVRVENNALITKSIVTLPYKNPLFLSSKGPSELLVTCTGIYDQQGAKLTSINAGLIKLEIKNSTITTMWDTPLKNFIPGEPAFVKEHIIVPEAYGKRVMVLNDKSPDSNNIKIANNRYDFRFTLAALWHSDIVFLADEALGLVAFSLSEGFLPFPFNEPIPLDQKQRPPIMFSPNKILFRPQEKREAGFSAWVLSHTQNKIVPLDLLELFGP